MKKLTVVLLLICTLTLCFAPLSVNAQEKDNSIKIGTSLTGILESDKSISHSFTVDKPGKVTISIYTETDVTEGDFGCRISGIGTVGANITSWRSINGKFSYTVTKYLEKGEYAYNFSCSGNGIYTIESSFEEAKESFEDTQNGDDNTINAANEISLSEIYYGLIMDDDIDLFFFTVQENSTIDISFNCYATSGWFEYKIYNNELNIVTEKNLGHYNKNYGGTGKYINTHNLDAGKYYLLVEASSTGYGGPYDFLLTPECIVHTYDNACDSNCNVCGKTQNITHNFGDWTSNDDTTHTRTCTCGEAETENHSWNVGIETKHPTHTDYGEMTYTCSDCGETKTDKIDKLASHSYGDWIKVDGSTHKRTCTCGEVEIENHIFGEWIVTKETTEMEKGSKTKTCACGYMITEDIPVLDDKTDFPDGSDLVPEPTINNHGLSNGVITGIIIGSLVIFSGSGLSVYWFLIKKKTWTDLLRAFKSQGK